MKTCVKCNTEKELANFSNSNIRNDGLRNDCKKCERELKSLLRLQARVKTTPIVKTNRKVCPICTLEKGKKEFFIRNTNKDGFSTICKVCFQHHHDNEKIKANTVRKIQYVKNLEVLGKDIPDDLSRYVLLNPDDYKYVSLKVPKKDHGEGSKVCPICSVDKQRSEYTVQSTRKDKLAPNCKQCVSEHYKSEQVKYRLCTLIRHVQKLESDGKPIPYLAVYAIGLNVEDYAPSTLRL